MSWRGRVFLPPGRDEKEHASHTNPFQALGSAPALQSDSPLPGRPVGPGHRRRPPAAPTPPAPGAAWLGFVLDPPTTDAGNGGRSGRSRSKSCSPPCFYPNGFRPRQWTPPLPVSDAPGPSARTTPPSDKRIPNWSQRPAPSPATTTAAPSAPESRSWPGSPDVCLRSREGARPRRRAPGSPPAGRRSKTKSRPPTAE